LSGKEKMKSGKEIQSAKNNEEFAAYRFNRLSGIFIFHLTFIGVFTNVVSRLAIGNWFLLFK
jgi:hypothetical protein